MGYVPLRPVDVAKALKLGTEADGILIAKEFLSGKIAFKKRELRKLAAYKELTLDEIMEADPFLKKYRDPVMEKRGTVAKRAVHMCTQAYVLSMDF